MATAKVVTVIRRCAQDEVNQEESELDEIIIVQRFRLLLSVTMSSDAQIKLTVAEYTFRLLSL